MIFSGGINNNEFKKKTNDSVGLGSLKDAPPLPGMGKKNDPSTGILFLNFQVLVKLYVCFLYLYLNFTLILILEISRNKFSQICDAFILLSKSVIIIPFSFLFVCCK